ncbi:hypothetical protein ACTFIT_007688 [Dictyostelium discoideum]
MKITNNTTNIKQHKCLQKISEIVDKTQLKKKQFKYVININHEPDDKIKKDLEKIANLIAIIFEKIWHKRNKLVHDEKEIIIHRQQVIRELIKTQRAAWDRTQAVIDKTLRIKSKQRPEEQNKLDSLISLKLLQFSRQWNSPLHAIELPKHLKKYNNSLSTFYK